MTERRYRRFLAYMQGLTLGATQALIDRLDGTSVGWMVPFVWTTAIHLGALLETEEVGLWTRVRSGHEVQAAGMQRVLAITALHTRWLAVDDADLGPNTGRAISGHAVAIAPSRR